MRRPESSFNTEPQWFVAHTRPRAEKKLAHYCDREGFTNELPTVRTVRKYQRKICKFDNPLFPGYLFLRINPASKQKVFQSDYCARIIQVNLQDEFEQQLRDILQAVRYAEDNEIILCPSITEGLRVRIKSGPLTGLEGVVARREGISNVHLNLDFIGQSAIVKLEASRLEAT